MAEIGIDRLTPEHRAAWLRLFQGYNLFYERPEMDPAVYDRAWTEFMAETRMHARGAWLDGALVGIVHFFVHPSTVAADVCYLQDLFTDPGCRGRGVARALIAEVERWSRERGCSRLYWTTHESNTTARRLYDRVAEFRGFIRYDLDL